MHTRLEFLSLYKKIIINKTNKQTNKTQVTMKMKQAKEITSDQVLGLSANLFLMPLDLK